MRMIIGTFLVAVVATSASAACGGGGYRADAKPGIAPSKPQASSVSSTLSTRETSTVAVVHNTSFGARFDAISSKLNLSSDQSHEVSGVRSDVQKQLGKLQDKQANAQGKLDRCNGNCASETKKLGQAKDEFNSYNASLDFERKLLRVLNSSQTVTYRSSK